MIKYSLLNTVVAIFLQSEVGFIGYENYIYIVPHYEDLNEISLWISDYKTNDTSVFRKLYLIT